MQVQLSLLGSVTLKEMPENYFIFFAKLGQNEKSTPLARKYIFLTQIWQS